MNIDLDSKVVEKLQKRADENKRSKKAEAELIIEEALQWIANKN